MKLRMSDIPLGKENAVTRPALKAKLGCSDRDMRDEVAKLRAMDDGTDDVIISSSGHPGFYRSSNEKEIMRMVAENNARIKSLKRVNRIALRKRRRKMLRDMHGEGIA